MGGKLRRVAIAALALVLLGLAGCSGANPLGGSGNGNTLRIVAGSEQRAVLDQIVIPWCEEQGYACEYELMGSVDQARLLGEGSTDYDAYWFASSVFAQLGDRDNRLRDTRSMFTTPVVFAGRRSAMESIDMVGNESVTVGEVIEAVESDTVQTWTTNPTQSNSGATSYFAFLNHFADNGPGEPLLAEQLDSAPVNEGIASFIEAIDRTPPSTGTMMEECVADAARCDTVFTYEALVIEQNQQLIARGEEPFHAVYPQGALAISDAPLGFLPQDAPEGRAEIFAELQDYLLTDDAARQALLDLGRRPADSIGLTLDNPDTTVFNPDWGIRTDIQEQGITYPAADVIETALERYHSAYRPGVATYYCLDGSGSMRGNGWRDVTAASGEIFEPEQARRNLLHTGPEDHTAVEIFHQGIAQSLPAVDGEDAEGMRNLHEGISAYRPGGGTDMYSCVDRAVGAIAADDTERRSLIVLMSDGRSDGSLSPVSAQILDSGDIPVVAIAFGSAVPEQLTELAQDSGGVYVESDDLVAALREATGYR